MVLSAGRAYSDAVKWLKTARPRRFSRLRYAERAVGATVAGAVPLLTLIALGSPSSFGSRGSNTLQSGWPMYVLLGLLALSLVYLFAHMARIRWSLARTREPFVREPRGDVRYENAADNLAACPAPLKTRFAVQWIWGPLVIAVLAIMAGFAATYFLIDAIVARFSVGWYHPVYAAANIVVSLVLFALVSGRLITWRLAVAVHRSVTVGY